MLTQKLAKEAKKTRLVFVLEVIVALVEIDETIDNLRVTEEVLQANRIDLSLELERTKAQAKTALQEMSTSLLLRDKKLVVLDSNNNLRTRLIRQIHAITVIVYPGQNKTKVLIKRLYWWPNQGSDAN